MVPLFLAAVLALPGAPATHSISRALFQAAPLSAAAPVAYREILVIDPSAQVLLSAEKLGLPRRRSADLPALGLRVVTLDRQTAQQGDAAAVLQLLGNVRQFRTEIAQGKFRPADPGPVQTLLPDMVQRRIQRRDVR
ncbi:MAG: hypothetical protein IIB66_10230, partial [Proteobacteria bacterium]|nr:hypothetical protein [Pseudomonadota bacterium]